MLIFALMVTSMGVLYARISPTLFGFEAKTQSTNQEFVLLTISNTMQELIGSAENSQGRVHIISNQAIYSVNPGIRLQIDVDYNGTPYSSVPTNIGTFTANVSGVYDTQAEPVYLNERTNELSYLSGDLAGIDSRNVSKPSYVSKVTYQRRFANFSLFFKARLDLTNTTQSDYVLTITIVSITYNTEAGDPIDFPLDNEEWTLRLRRKATVPQTPVINQPITNENITVSDNFGTNVIIPGFNPGDTLTIRYIQIPILFGI
jgi:hypothetical protein